MISVGETAWVQPGTDRAYVGLVVEMTATEIVLEDAVQVHEHGIWERFHAGKYDGARRAHVSANPKGSRMTLPRLVCRTMRFTPPLDELRAWAEQR